MFMAKVIGNVWATRKHERLNNLKMLLVKPVASDKKSFVGNTTLAVDGGFGAGIGDIVIVVDEGGSAKNILKDPKAPVRTIICGIVD